MTSNPAKDYSHTRQAKAPSARWLEIQRVSKGFLGMCGTSQVSQDILVGKQEGCEDGEGWERCKDREGGKEVLIK